MRPYVVVGHGVIGVGEVRDPESGDCVFVAQLPIEFSNSGRRSAILERFVSDDALSPIIFANGADILDHGATAYDLFLTEAVIKDANEWKRVFRDAPKLNLAESRFVRIVVSPEHSHTVFLSLRARIYPEGERIADQIFLSLVAEFSNGASYPVRAAIEVPKSREVGCSAG